MKMRLEFTEDLAENELELVKNIAAPRDVVRLMDRMAWDEISMVMLANDQGIELEASGSKEDGMSVSYTEEGKSWISTTGPTMDECKKILQQFAAGDETWRDTMKFEFLRNADGSMEGSEAAGIPKPINISIMKAKFIMGLFVVFLFIGGAIAVMIICAKQEKPKVPVVKEEAPVSEVKKPIKRSSEFDVEIRTDKNGIIFIKEKEVKLENLISVLSEMKIDRKKSIGIYCYDDADNKIVLKIVEILLKGGYTNVKYVPRIKI